jgi:rhomboid family GlyGly-CTERM serine protease
MNRTPHEHHPARGGRTVCVSLVLTALAVGAFLAPGAADWLAFDRQAVSDGQLWRVLTGHWTHFSFDHLVWDVIGFACLAVMCERYGRTRFVACVAVSAVAISVTLWWAEPSMIAYRGLSGLDSALFGLLAVLVLREGIERGDRLRVGLVSVFFALFVVKVSYEFINGATIFVSNYGPSVAPLPLVHLVGAAVGALTGCSTGGRETTGQQASVKLA